jgi:tRNA (cytidine/uridine-2'-O-)-methyltransferase
LEIHDDLGTLLGRFAGRFAYFSTKGTKLYTEVPLHTDLLIFGQETKGLPPWVFEKWPEQAYKIPIFHEGVRSLNLANAVSVVLYDHLMRKRGAL